MHRSLTRRPAARSIHLTGGPRALAERLYEETLGLRIAQVCRDQAPDLWVERRASYDPRDVATVDGLIRDLCGRLACVLPLHECLLDDWYLEVDSTPDGLASLDEPPPYHLFLPVLYAAPYELDSYDEDTPDAEALLAFAVLGGASEEVAALLRRLERETQPAADRDHAVRVASALLGDDTAAQRLYDDAAGAFAGAPAPLDAVPAFLRYVTATTGHRWLDDADVVASGYEEVAWTVDAVREARASCEAAVAYLGSLRALRAYITTGQGFATLLVLIEHTLDRTGLARRPAGPGCTEQTHYTTGE